MIAKTLSQLPSVDAFLKSEEAVSLIAEYGRSEFVRAVRAELEEIRRNILGMREDLTDEATADLQLLLPKIEMRLKKKYEPSLRKAVNATGVILHTGLGRAVLAEAAKKTIIDTIEGYCTLATDPNTGRRGHRDIHLSDLLCAVTGAEAGTVVNNNAAATVLIFNTLAKGREVIVSRGQLVEIGGSFRMPEVMETSGAVMREGGTTNKTHLRDYAAAINENTGAILRVHHSNFRIMGFFEEPGIEELVELGQANNIPVIDDLGSGALVDLAWFGLETEPMVQKSIQAGVDVSCFSGDKLIGGPQSGVIVGKAAIVEKIRKNPLSRAFRVDKMTIAGMEATLKLFLNPDKIAEKHPSYRMFSLSAAELGKRASKVRRQILAEIPPRDASIAVIEGRSQVGSGSVPVETLPTKLLSVIPVHISSEEMARKLRHYSPAVFPRVQKNAVLFDFRTIQPDEDKLIKEALITLLKNEEEKK